jgi:hypothetical protein
VPWKTPVIGIRDACNDYPSNQEVRWHGTTVWRKASSGSSFPTIVCIVPKSPRLNSHELERWISRSKSVNSDLMYIFPDLVQGKARGP